MARPGQTIKGLCGERATIHCNLIWSPQPPIASLHSRCLESQLLPPILISFPPGPMQKPSLVA
jgi:hypothetical protein